MTEKKDQLIGIRFTKQERTVIEALAENRNLTITDFVREAVFSHINQLEENVGNLNVEFFMKNFEIMKDSIENLHERINVMKKEFNIYDIAKIEHNLLKTNRNLRNLENL